MFRHTAGSMAAACCCWLLACGGAEFGASATGGSGGTGNGGGSSGGAATGGVGTGGGTQGTGGGTGGDMGTGGRSADASSTEGGSGCQDPIVWYPDSDQDGHGRPDGTSISCDPPTTGHWVEIGDDCDDTNWDVHPGADYFDTPYATSAGAASFDYDCSDTEDPAPAQALAPDSCGLLSACSGEGFVPNARTGAGVNPYCGSLTYRKCVLDNLLVCTASVTSVVPGQGYKCH